LHFSSKNLIEVAKKLSKNSDTLENQIFSEVKRKIPNRTKKSKKKIAEDIVGKFSEQLKKQVSIYIENYVETKRLENPVLNQSM